MCLFLPPFFFLTGTTFGERSLLTNEPISKNIFSKSELVDFDTSAKSSHTLVAGLSKDSFNQLPRRIVEAIEKQLISEILSSHDILKHLNATEKSIVEKSVQFQNFDHEEYLITENEMVDHLYILRSGFCRVTKLPHKNAAKSVAVDIHANVTVNSVLGEASLRNGTPAGASVICKGPVECYIFPKSIFQQYLLNSPYLKRLMDQRKEDNITTLKTSSLKNLKFDNFLWEHPLVLHRKLCSLRLVCHRATNGYFACRSISKKYIEGHKRHTRLVQERDFLLTLHSPFIVQLISTFKDVRTIYMVGL